MRLCRLYGTSMLSTVHSKTMPLHHSPPPARRPPPSGPDCTSAFSARPASSPSLPSSFPLPHPLTSAAFCLVTSDGVSRCTPLTVQNTSGQPGIWRWDFVRDMGWSSVLRKHGRKGYTLFGSYTVRQSNS